MATSCVMNSRLSSEGAVCQRLASDVGSSFCSCIRFYYVQRGTFSIAATCNTDTGKTNSAVHTVLD